ncbi:HEAT repeat protein-like protein [Aaosphaeria arxii CBS 175.79]|uniref:HEAT repeat protein-like protein n=1 Tax=Aaosphaeria arxii CBS 175.79 TaxID=1450172 RepID=A0A6A5XQF0_9PLEO|nr:HEAT repeat protein-like protein [Aaosphaeria arxii CBS 175.79]KAF2015392.1 HEAT repeat protein-like protein [Aaosphaeria arxii CBS 175.79]
MERQRTFQRLKKRCVELIQATSSFAQRPNTRTEVVQSLTALLHELQEVTAQPNALDEKLAEFVFVPISQVLRLSQRVPVRALELSLGCISILLQNGWKGNLSQDLFSQLLILFTFLANPSSAHNGIPETSEELQVAAFQCMAELITEMSRSLKGREYLTDTSNIPSLSKAVLLMVDSLAEASSNDVKLQALCAIEAVTEGVSDQDALASFVPRLLSSLTKVLTPSSTNRSSFRVIVRGLNSFSLILLKVLSDGEVGQLPSEVPSAKESTDKVMRTTSWLHATANQIKIALANVYKLKHHSKEEVRHALLGLCFRVLQDCRKSLADCSSMTIEIVISLAGRGDRNSTAEKDLRLLLSSDTRFCSLLRESLYGWVISLPRLMQSSDDSARRQIMHQISTALRLLNDEGVDTTIIDDILAENLRGSFASILKDASGAIQVVDTASATNIDTSLVLGSVRPSSFDVLELRFKSQDDMMTEYKVLLQRLAQTKSANTVARDLVNAIYSENQETQLASFWLSVNLVKEILKHDTALDEFLSFGTPSIQSELLDEMYSFSISNLSSSDIDADWRLQALSLEVLALQAERYGDEFQAELIDALYPVLHLLGTTNPRLRNHAIVCLNIIAKSSGYTSARELIIANVDYVVNAVGLKLNYHDISPQAPQVLLMAMRLCGPSLLPYLDDLVGSIFSALERYHGYPKLVELLFSTLKVMAEEGVKSPQLMLTENEHKPVSSGRKPRSMLDTIHLIKAAKENSTQEDEEHESRMEASFPRRPWKEMLEKKTGDGGDKDADDEEEDEPEEENAVQPVADAPVPAPETFNILLKISELTQYYLTSPSPSLRTSLLSLLHTTIPALAKHENSFLPLINTLWPVLVPRLDDPEAYIISGALDIMALLCTYAGDFMKSRIQDIWNTVRQLHRRVNSRQKGMDRATTKTPLASLNLNNPHDTSAVVKGRDGALDSFRPELYTDTPNRMIRGSLIRFLSSVAQHVAVQEEFFDDIVDMLDPVLDRIEVREALDSRNPDAVWLRTRMKEIQLPARNQPKGISAVQEKSEIRLPQGRPEWQFISF